MTSSPVPLVDLVYQHRLIADEIAPELERVMGSGGFTDGPDVAAFEAEFATFSNAGHAVGCANGTDALELVLRATGIGHGDEVIVPANTFAATAEAVVRVGAVPVFADVDPDSLLLDPAAADSAVTARTHAVIPVHLYGQMAPLARLRELAAAKDLVLLADAAQAQGASSSEATGIAAGVTAAATSFYPGKNLGAYGDAGAVVTDDPRLAEIVRSIGHHGADPADRYLHARLGYTSRLDTIQAVVLRAKLRRLAGWNDERRAAARRYDELLADVDGVRLPVTREGNVHVWHLYGVRVAARDEVLAALKADGIGAGIHYPIPLHLQPVFAPTSPGRGAFPNAEAAASSVLSLPLSPGITDEQQVRVAEALAKAVAAHR